jgi:hypothetical protein
LGSIGVGFGFEVGAAASTGVGFGFGKPLREELAGEGVVCAFTTASSRLFLNSSAAFFSCCFCKKNTPPRPRKITTKMVFLITENRATMSYTLRAFDSVFQHRTDNFFGESPQGLGLSGQRQSIRSRGRIRRGLPVVGWRSSAWAESPTSRG